MKLNFNNLPIGNLPYEKIDSCKRMMLKLYENTPYLAELPQILNSDTLLNRTLRNISGLHYKNNKIVIDLNRTSGDVKAANQIDNAYNTDDYRKLDKYSIDAPYFSMLEKMLKKIKPQFTVLTLLGPFSLAHMIENEDTAVILNDKLYRKFLIQALSIKVLWFINKVRQFSPDTFVLTIFEEPYLSKFGTFKHKELISEECVITMYAKLFQKIHSAGGFVGVQSFNKCNWLLPINAGVDMLSFDAYNNPASLSIIAEQINNFLMNGGYINWGIVPVSSEKIIKRTTIDNITDKFNTSVNELSSKGVNLNLIYKHSTVSVQGNLSKLPIMFAEKALILAEKLSQKINMVAV